GRRLTEPACGPAHRGGPAAAGSGMEPTLVNDNAIFEQMMDQLHAREARLAPLWQMSAGERVSAMYNGELTYEQCLAWAARCPNEVPTLDGEWWFIAITMPEICEAPVRDARPAAARLRLVTQPADPAEATADRGPDLRDVA